MVDPEISKNLNLLHGSPAFLLRHLADGVAEIVKLASIPADGHTYSVAAESILPNGTRVASVLVFENGGGNLRKVYWLVADGWCEPADAEAEAHLGEDRFPFDWTTAIPLENDAYHRD